MKVWMPSPMKVETVDSGWVGKFWVLRAWLREAAMPGREWTRVPSRSKMKALSIGGVSREKIQVSRLVLDRKGVAGE